MAPSGEVFDYLVSHGRMKEIEARAKFRQVSVQHLLNLMDTLYTRLKETQCMKSMHLFVMRVGIHHIRSDPQCYRILCIKLQKVVPGPQGQLPSIHVCVHLVFQIVSAVHYCHQKYIVHRDLKVKKKHAKCMTFFGRVQEGYIMVCL